MRPVERSVRQEPGSQHWPGVVFFAILLALSLTSGWEHSVAAPLEKKETFSKLCGRLVFITVRRTEQKLIGLLPCGEPRPYVFEARPGSLHNYYRFHDLVAQDGPEIITEEWGRLGMYITKFSRYEPIESCSGCTQQAPTRTPAPQRAAENCGELLLQIAAERFPEVAVVETDAAAELSAYRTGNELAELCSADTTCAAEAIARRTGEILGRSAERTPQRRDDLITLLSDVIEDSAAAPVCRDLPGLVHHIAAGLSIEGFAIDALAITSPATHWVTDGLGRTAGLLDNGAVAVEIPGSKVVVTGQNKLILLPGHMLVEASARGVGSGQARMDVALNEAGEVWLASFIPVLFAPGTHYILSARQSPSRLILGGSDVPLEALARSFEILPAAGWLATPPPPPTPILPTAKPTATATPAPTDTPSPTPSETPTKAPATPATPSPAAQSAPGGLVCPGGIGAVALPAMMWISHRRRCAQQTAPASEILESLNQDQT